MSWSKTKGETHEETLTWSVDSQVSETFSVVGGALCVRLMILYLGVVVRLVRAVV